MTHKKVICVLGMHRSGTSAITRTLNLIGVNLGESEKLMKPGFDNPKGYWENTEIVDIHDRILKTFSSSWDSTQPLPDKWWKRAEIIPFRNMLAAIANNNLLNQDIWMWKDPRTSLLVPLWLEILKDLNITPLFVICIRNPLDVYLSLEKRNQFSKEKAFRLWNLYTLSALYWTKFDKRTIVHYDSLLNDRDGTLRKMSYELNIFFTKDKNQIYNELNDFIDQNLRHSYSSIDQLLITEGLLKETKILYQLLLEVLKIPSTIFNNTVEELYLNLLCSK